MTDRPYQLIRSKRRTLSIEIDGKGALVVRAPMRMPLREIEAFLVLKSGWIAQKQALVRSRTTFVLADGAEMPFAGSFLKVRYCSVPMGMDRDGYLLLPQEAPETEAREWRRQRAAELLGPRIAYWEGRTGISPSSVAYSNARKRWGSMKIDGSLRLNAALVHCPSALWDYVIVHELAHRVHMNHSPAFHALVRSILPDADKRRSELKTMGYLMEIL